MQNVNEKNPANFHGQRVLIVDNNATNALELHERLSQWSLSPTVVSSAAACLSELRHPRDPSLAIKVVLLVATMLERDGREVLDHLQREPSLASVPVILVSPIDRPPEDEPATSSLIHPPRLKPVSPKTLREALESVFSVSLTNDSVSNVLASPVTSIAPTTHPRTILLADDVVVNQRVITKLLEQRGHRVTVVGNGREAVEYSQTGQYDVILMEIQMPVLDGFLATREIREREQGNAPPVQIIALTADVLERDRQQCIAAGMDDFIAKPFVPERLFEAIEHPVSAAPAAQTPHNGSTEFDFDAVLKNTGHAPSFVRELIKMFQTESVRQLDAIRDAVAARDAQQIQATAHILKGSVSLFGAKACIEAALKLEKMGEHDELCQVDQQCQHVCDLTEALRESLKEF
ncbi:Aerobic respiration control sensor protein ArcB [Novipirellula galeiformis]|uniref:Aerobic respiration control sensor protein ArcB n=1 Tax=Novipirellula galeiformis TaxID=2528004 RepID=A0A5C6CDY0_9BACT|nr:response regulator [Novipirellula galeiformis]TWU21631.1 Aerobic respiration control sensor protein ArcB [Novipirellula galeiformis]